MTDVVLSIRGTQNYPDQELERVELVTEGVMEFRDGKWDVSYQESALTGLEGVTTTFRAEPKRVTLIRKGALNSEMVFQQGVEHQSLYQMPFGTLMLTIEATWVVCSITPEGGTIDLSYIISIEDNDAGMIDYHVDIRVK